MTRICEKFNEKNLPYGSCKKVEYFPTLGGRGGDSDRVGNFQLFFVEPFPYFKDKDKSAMLFF